jgi:hypothetical protein
MVIFRFVSCPRASTSERASETHARLQMIALLPEAVHAIDMMADWIVESFEKHEAKTRPKSPMKTLTAPPRIDAASSGPLSHPNDATPPDTTSTPGLTSESDRDDNDNILSFTPKKRSPRTSSASASRNDSPSPAPPGTILPALHDFSRRLTSLSSSDEACSSRSFPRTPDHRFSPPSLPTTNMKGLPEFAPCSSSSMESALLPPLQHIILPHERALRDELYATPLSSSSPLPPHHHHHPATRRFFTEPPQSSPVGEAMSDDEVLVRAGGGGGEGEGEEGATTTTATTGAGAGEGAHPHQTKTTRSGSAGSLPVPVLPANFIDAKDLLRRRREEAVFGISTSSSAVPSDDEESAGKKDKERGGA